MKFKSLLVTIGLITPLVMLGLVSCGGGNDLASSGASAVSAAAPTSAAAPSTTATAASAPATAPKINGQID